MLEKYVAVTGMAVTGMVGYGAIANNMDAHLQEAQVVAVFMQEHQLKTALELYHLKRGSYPDVEDEAMIVALHDAGVLEEPKVSGTVSYSRAQNGRSYTLSVTN